MEMVQCDLCGSTKALEYCASPDRLHAVTKDVFTVVKCQDCGLLYTNPRPDRDEIKKYYPSQSYYAYQKTSHKSDDGGGRRLEALESTLEIRHGFPATGTESGRVNRKKLLAYISTGRYMGYPSFRSGARILDVGCGSGFFLEVMKKYGIEARGIEIDRTAVKVAQEIGLNVTEGALESVSFPERSFDCVRVGHVLEHLASPKQSLKIIYRLLAANGEVIILVPNAASMLSRIFGINWFHLDLPRHLYHFTPATISQYLKTIGFSKIQIRCYSAEQSFLGSLDYLLRSPDWTNATSSSLLTKSMFRIPLIPIVQCLNILGMGDLMEVRGVKAS